MILFRFTEIICKVKLSQYEAVNCNHKFQFFNLWRQFLFLQYLQRSQRLDATKYLRPSALSEWKDCPVFRSIGWNIILHWRVWSPEKMYCNLYLCCIIRWTSLPVVYGTGYTSCSSVFMGCLLISPASRSITSKHCISWKRFHRIRNVLIPLYKICRKSGLVLSSLCKR